MENKDKQLELFCDEAPIIYDVDLTIYIPKPILEWFLKKYYDWKLYGDRIHKDSVSYNEDGYWEKEISCTKDTFEYWDNDFKEKLSGCMYIKNYPLNIKY